MSSKEVLCLFPAMPVQFHKSFTEASSSFNITSIVKIRIERWQGGRGTVSA